MANITTNHAFTYTNFLRKLRLTRGKNHIKLSTLISGLSHTQSSKCVSCCARQLLSIVQLLLLFRIRKFVKHFQLCCFTTGCHNNGLLHCSNLFMMLKDHNQSLNQGYCCVFLQKRQTSSWGSGCWSAKPRYNLKMYSKNVTTTHHTLLTVPSFYFLDFGVFEKDSLQLE